MNWSLEVSTAPAREPLSLDEVHDHLNVATTDEDAYLDSLILGARDWAERELSRALLTQTRKLRLPRFPGWELALPYPPLQSVTSIVYLDTSNVSTTLATTEYQVFGARTTPDAAAPPAFIVPAYGKIWPFTSYSSLEAVTITFVAGWLTAGAIPRPIIQEMLNWVAAHYYNRGDADGLTALVAACADRLGEHRCYREFDYC